MASKLDRIFKALSDPTRRSILQLLVVATGAVNITTIADQFHSTRQAVTKHIQVLEQAGLVKASRIGREAMYTATPEKLAILQEWLVVYERFWDGKLGALGAHLANKKRVRP